MESGKAPERDTQVVWASPGKVFQQVFRPTKRWEILTGAVPQDEDNLQAQSIAAVYFRLAVCADIAKGALEEVEEHIRQEALATWTEIYYFCRRQGASKTLAWSTTDEVLGGSVLSMKAFRPEKAVKEFAAEFIQCLLDDPEHCDSEY